MSTFTCKIANDTALQIKLLRDGYEIVNMNEAIKYQSENKEIVLEINTDNKTFTVHPAENFPFAITDESCVEKALGMTESLNDYHNSIIQNPVKHLVESLTKIIAPEQKTEPADSNIKAYDISEDLTKLTQPGDWVSFTIKGKQYFGLAIFNDTLMYMTSSGNICGYLTNFTNQTPFVFHSIRRPTKECFRLHEYDNMQLIWENKPKVKKTIQEIEKELGLTPGTLSII